jgi:hypothetical protein
MKDLFDTPELLPIEVQNVLEEFSYKDQTYENCQQLIAALEPLGYTCDYDLSGTPFGLTNFNL